jgi:hypothetical protein
VRGLTRRPLATTRRNARARTFGRYSRLCPLRRSLPSQRIATGQTRDAHAECAKRPNASQPRRRSGTHFAALHTNGFAAESRPHTGRIPTAIQWKHEGSRIVHPMIPTLPPLCGGSQQRSGRTHTFIARIARQVRTTHAPLAAKCRPMRTPKWRFAVGHGRHQPRSLAQRQHPSRSPHESLEPSGFAAERRPHTCRILTAIRRQPRRVPNRQSDDPGPCRRCAAVLSSAADAPTHLSLGSHAKSGPPMRRSPRTAVPCGVIADTTADTDMALRCRPRTPPTPQLGAEAAPIQIAA